jgi:hypothetical protein
MHISALDFTLHRCLGGQSPSCEHGVAPSWQRPLRHDPGRTKQQVTKPGGFPQTDRAAQRLTSPLQFAGRPSSAISLATHLTCSPWVEASSQGQRSFTLAKANAAELGASQPTKALLSW